MDQDEYLCAKVIPKHPTEVLLILFGETVVLHYGDVEAAAQRAAHLNTHLEKEWQRLRETNSSILEAFAEKLRAEGVFDGDIRRAMEAVMRDAKQMEGADGG